MKTKKSKIKWLFFIVFLLVSIFYFQPIFAAVEPDLGLDEVGQNSGLADGDLRVMIGRIIKVSLGFLGAVALVLVLYGGYLYMTSEGQEEKISKAKKVIVSAIIGLALIFSAYAITSFVFRSLDSASNGSSSFGDGSGSGSLVIGGSGSPLIATSITPSGHVDLRNVKVRIKFSKPINSGTVNSENIGIYKKGGVEKIKTFSEVLAINENNNNQEILSAVQKNDEIFTENWVVCGADQSGDSPMTAEFNTLGDQSVQLIIDSINSTNAEAANKTFSITCKQFGTEQIYTVAEDAEFINGENIFDVPALCLGGEKTVVTLIRKGNACLNIDYLALMSEKEESTEEDSLVSGELSLDDLDRSLVYFSPDADCGEDFDGLKCFDADSDYKVKLKEGGVRSITGDLSLSCSSGSQCENFFSTGNLIDTASPTVNFVYPADRAKVSVNRFVDVAISGSDDSGISNIEFFVNEELQDLQAFTGNWNQKDFTADFLWDTSGLATATRYKLKGVANDIDSNFGAKEITVSILPEECFDNNGNILCDSDNSRPACGACDNSACENDDDCAGVCVRTCTGDNCSGICETAPIITDFEPKQAGIGSLITVAGSGFGTFVQNFSKVYFSNAQGEYIPAEIGCNDSFSWSSNSVIVKVPEGAVDGPIKLVTGSQKFDTTDNEDGGVRADFIVNNALNLPGLCAITKVDCAPSCVGSVCNFCNSATIGAKVKAEGVNFGSTKKDDAGIYFGSIKGLFAAGFSWDDKLINNIEIPNIANQKYNVSVSLGESCLDNNNEPCVATEENCSCEIVNSNPVLFEVEAESNVPKIDSINPAIGPVGQFITINGQNFGSDVGYVTIEREVDGVPFEWVMSGGCGDKSWLPNQVVVKIPEKIATQLAANGENFHLSRDYKIKIYDNRGLVSNAVDFEINDELPTPGLCAIDPSAGPVGAKIEIIGENFGENKSEYDLFFSKNGGDVLNCPDGVEPCSPGVNLCACSWSIDPGVRVASIAQWSDQLISEAAVPAEAVSGGIFFRDGNGRTSNAVNFNVGNCSANSCESGKECCADGTCRDVCQEEVFYLPSEYMWLVSTGPLPLTPAVLERACLTGYYSQSPSPVKSSEDACPNGLISASFNMLMAPNDQDETNTFNNNIVIKRCLTSGVKCDFNSCSGTGNQTCVQKTIARVSLNDLSNPGLSYNCQKNNVVCDPNAEELCVCENSAEITTLALNSSITDPINELLGNGNIFEDLGEDVGLYKNSWYEVVIKGGDGGVGTGRLNATLAKDYSWQFKTKNENCQPTDLLLTPLVGLIDEINDQEKYNISGQYACQSISLRHEDWLWDFVESTEKARFAGYACLTDLPLVCSDPELRRNDIGVFEIKPNSDPAFVYETQPGQPLKISASAEENDFLKEGFLNINFVDPRIVSFYPDCEQACINSEIGATFNVPMAGETFVPNESVKLYECRSSTCSILTPVSISAEELNYSFVDASAISEAKNLLSLNIMNGLLPNTYYRVVIDDSVKSNSGVSLVDLNYQNENVSGGDCQDGFDNDNDSAIDFSGGYVGKDNSGALNYSCGCYSTQESRFVSFAEIGQQCAEPEIFGCLNLKEGVATLITDAQELISIKSDNIYYEPDEQCQNVNGFEIGNEGAYDSFSFVFKTKNDTEFCRLNDLAIEPKNYVSEQEAEKIEYWVVPSASPDSCSASGQRLNPFLFNWNWQSSDNVVATISNNIINKDGFSYCDEKCLTTGSFPYGAVCGNNRVEKGEECDDGNLNNDDDCTDQCLFSAVNLVVCENKTDNDCCGNGQVEEDEECDDGEETVSCSAKCRNKGTDIGYFCGNFIKEPGEDNDFGVLLNKIYGLTDKCLNAGSVYKKDQPQALRVCGNGILEEGEECEAVCLIKGSGVVCSEGSEDCFCSMENNPYCNNKCIWQGFSSCQGGCQKEEECYSGDPGCVGYKYLNCDSGVDCIGTRNIPCQSSDKDCVNGQKQINCLVDQTVNCANGRRKVECSAEDSACIGEKSLLCSNCVNGTATINCAMLKEDRSANASCVNGKMTVSCPEVCSDQNNIFAISCNLGQSGCVNNKKTVVCGNGDRSCSCTNCCGNGIIEDYNNNNDFGSDYNNNKLVMTEECEADCLNSDGDTCNFGDDDCQCEMPASCSSACLNVGSSMAYDAICGDGVWQNGEDSACECLEENCQTLRKGAPYQVAETIGDLADYLENNSETQASFVYDLTTKYIIGSTDISVALLADSGKAAMTKLFYRTNDPDILEKYKNEIPNITDYFNPCESDPESYACKDYCLDHPDELICCVNDPDTKINECENPCLLDPTSAACLVFCERYPTEQSCCTGDSCNNEPPECSTVGNVDYFKSYPTVNSSNACPNALIKVYLNNRNVDVMSAVVELLEETTDANACDNSVGVISKIKNFFVSMLIKTGLADTSYSCPTAIDVVPTIISTGRNIYTAFEITPMAMLKNNTKYTVRFSGMKNECGADIDPVVYSFRTRGDICQLEYLSVVPNDVFINKAQTTTPFEVLPMSGEQPIAEINNVYEWDYSWQAADTSIVDSIKACQINNEQCLDIAGGSLNSKTVNVRNTAKNGNTYLEAKATITKDFSRGTTGNSTTGAIFSGTANLTVFLCDNLWNPEAPDENWQTMSTNLSTGEYFTTYLWEKNYNIGLFYCRDAGEVGNVNDDLPKLTLGSSVIDSLGLKKHNAIFLDGESDWLKINNSSFVNKIDFDSPDQYWTIDTWIFLDTNQALPGYRNVFYKNREDNSNMQLALEYLGNSAYKVVYQVGPEKKISGVINNLHKGFNHLAFVHYEDKSSDGGNKIYINGEELSSYDVLTENLPVFSTTPSDKNFYVGGRGLDENSSLLGYLDEFRIWSRPLTLEENNDWRFRVLTGSESDLVASWKFDLNQGNGFYSTNEQLLLQANCSYTAQANSQCSGNNFAIIDLNAKINSAGYADFDFESAKEDENQCSDNKDNDGDGFIDMQDPKCSSAEDDFEKPSLLKQYFFVRENNQGEDPTNDQSADVISLRIYENPEYLNPEDWYKKYAPNPGAVSSGKPVDCQGDEFGQFCYRSAQDQTTMYVSAANIYENTVYNNIYVLGFSANANGLTQNIYNQMWDLLKFNLNIMNENNLPKIKLVRDYLRYSDMVYLRNLVDEYKRSNGGSAPNLAAGSYVRGQTFSVWPSWQNELGKALKKSLPIDPLNHFLYVSAGLGENYTGQACSLDGEIAAACPGSSCKNSAGELCDPTQDSQDCYCNEEYQCAVPGSYCVSCPQGYDKQTCYNSDTQEFSAVYNQQASLNPVYYYLFDPYAIGNNSSYQFKFMKELSQLNHRVSPVLNNQ